jgi:hypothetical protein
VRRPSKGFAKRSMRYATSGPSLPSYASCATASEKGSRYRFESASQFSREYSRLFGDPPQRDIKRLRLI